MSDAESVYDGIEKEPRTATFNSKDTVRCSMDSVTETSTALGEKGKTMTVKEIYEKAEWKLDHNEITIGEFEKIVSADVVEVVRCGECKHLLPNGECMAFADSMIIPSASDFCSWGEREEDNEL